MTNTTKRTEAARLAGLAKRVSYPVARFDIEYRLIDAQHKELPALHTLKLVLSGEEARQMANALLEIADAIDAEGGRPQ